MSYNNRSQGSAVVETHDTDKGPKPYLVLRLFDDDKYPFKITVGRAKMILKHLDSVKNFVETYGTSRTTIGKALS